MIEIGAVYSIALDQDDGITPKGGYPSRIKYCVVIAKPDSGLCVAYVVVNHQINERFNDSKQLIDNFFPIYNREYPGFILPIYDPSWIDLNKVREMDAERLEREGIMIGKLSEKDLGLIRLTIASNDFSFSRKQRKRWGLIP